MEPPFVVLYGAATLVNALLALWILLRRPQQGLGAGRVAGCALAVITAVLLESLLLFPLGLHPFGAVRIAWLALTVVTPLCGFVVLWLSRGGRRRVGAGARIGAWLGLAMIPLAVYAQLIEPYDLRLERATVRLAPERAGRAPLTLGVLADLQTPRVTEHEWDAVRRLMACEPDLILVPGDIYQGPEADFEAVLPAFRELFAALSAPGGVWVVLGNTDYHAGVPRILEGSGARLLRDETVHLTVAGRKLALLGLTDAVPFPKRPSGGDLARAMQGLRHLPGTAMARLADFGRHDSSEEIRIVLSHRPRAVMHLAPDSRVDLVVAGHTHGGQVVLPWVGPPLVLSPLPNTIAAGGLHAYRGNTLYISRGVGMERDQAPGIRFLCPPEVSLLTLETPRE